MNVVIFPLGKKKKKVELGAGFWKQPFSSPVISK